MVKEEFDELQEKMMAGDFKRLMVFRRKAITLKSAIAVERNIAKINIQIREAKRKENIFQEKVDKMQFYQEELLRVKEKMEIRYKLLLGLIDDDELEKMSERLSEEKEEEKSIEPEELEEDLVAEPEKEELEEDEILEELPEE